MTDFDTYAEQMAAIFDRTLGPWAGECARRPVRRGGGKSDADLSAGDYLGGDGVAEVNGDPTSRRVWP